MNKITASPRELVESLRATTHAVVALDRAPIHRALADANEERRGLLQRLLR